MKGVLIFLLTTLTAGFANAAEKAPVTMHLELAKDTLALAEPTMMTIRLQNNQDSSLRLSIWSMHPYEGFQIFLIKPDGEEWLFGNGSRICGDHFSDSSNIYSLAENESITVDQFLWWPDFAPAPERLKAEDFNHGVYKIFGTYLHAGCNGKIFSDTISFVFLPLNETSLDALEQVCLANTPRYSFEETKNCLKRIRDSNTPYGEGAWAYLISMMPGNYDSLKKETIFFNEKYPLSRFRPFLLQYQFRACAAYNTIKKSRFDQNYKIRRTREIDSLLTEWERYSPLSLWMLHWKNSTRFITEIEIEEK